MSTLQRTATLRDRIGSRLGTILLALSVLCAVGVAVLILVPARHHAHKPTPPISAAHAQSAPVEPASVATTAPAGIFRDPATHALVRVATTAPVAAATTTPRGYFRDPATHALVRIGTSASGGAPLPANHTLGRIVR